jgi:hypothetical protein
MQIIELDARAWFGVIDFYAALKSAVRSPILPTSIDAWLDVLVWGGMGAMEPPYTIRVTNTSDINPVVRDEISLLAEMVANARTWQRDQRQPETRVSIRIDS